MWGPGQLAQFQGVQSNQAALLLKEISGVAGSSTTAALQGIWLRDFVRCEGPIYLSFPQGTQETCVGSPALTGWAEPICCRISGKCLKFSTTA